METLKELIALGNDGAPQAWLDSLTGQGIGEGMEGISAAEVERIIDSGELSAEAEQAIQASYEMRSLRAHPSNYTAGRGGNAIQYIVIHYTAGSTTSDGAAEANCIYFSREANLGASAHYFICDGYTVWNSVPEGDTAWHAGNWAINQRSIGIEVCSAGAFPEAEPVFFGQPLVNDRHAIDCVGADAALARPFLFLGREQRAVNPWGGKAPSSRRMGRRIGDAVRAQPRQGRYGHQQGKHAEQPLNRLPHGSSSRASRELWRFLPWRRGLCCWPQRPDRRHPWAA